MIDHEKWIGTLPAIKNKDSDHNTFCSNPNKWTDTIPKQKTKNGIKKFSLTLVLFVIGLILVSTIKNKTRNLQKEINNLQASISDLEIDLHKTILDYAQIWWKMMNKPSSSIYKKQADFRNEVYRGFKFGAALEVARKRNASISRFHKKSNNRFSTIFALI